MTTKEARKQIYDFLKRNGFDTDAHHDELKKLLVALTESVKPMIPKQDGNSVTLSTENTIPNTFYAPKTF